MERRKRRSRSRSRDKKKVRPIDVFLNMVSDNPEKSEAEKNNPKVEKQKPCFEPSGILAAERNTFKYVNISQIAA